MYKFFTIFKNTSLNSHCYITSTKSYNSLAEAIRSYAIPKEIIFRIVAEDKVINDITLSLFNYIDYNYEYKNYKDKLVLWLWFLNYYLPHKKFEYKIITNKQNIFSFNLT